MSYTFIYFDLDDTLLHHKEAEKSGLRDIHEHFAIFDNVEVQQLIDEYHSVNSRQWMLYSQGKVSRAELQRNRFEQTLQNLKLDGSRYKEIGNQYLQYYRNHWQWVDGAQQAYQNILAHYPVGILTNGFAETQQLKFEQFGFYESANHTVISEKVGALKPDPKVFAHATQLAGVNKNDILYVGDSFSSDIEGGYQFGWDTAWFTTNGDSDKQQKADFIFQDFESLCTYLRI